MSRDVTRIVELRLGWRLLGKELRLDAEVITTDRGNRCAHAVVLAHGHSVWSSPRTDPEVEVMQWLLGDAPLDWELNPARLPDQHVASSWGELLARLLATAAGESALDDEFFRPARAAATMGRITSTAHDEATAALPLETLVWPPRTAGSTTVVTGGDSQPISVVRVPARLSTRRTPKVALHERGQFRVRVATAPGPTHEYGLGDMAELVKRSAARRTMVEEISEVTSRSLTEVARGPAADLLVLCGHGRSHEGLCVAGPAGHTQIGGEQLAHDVVGAATVVVLAMCGSALGSAVVQGCRVPAPAEPIAELGADVVIGFHGDKANLADVQAFTSRLVGAIGQIVASSVGPTALDLVDWELAIAGARALLPSPTAPAVWVAPALLAGRSARRRVERTPTCDDDSAVATAFYVPGQIACTSSGDSTLRFALPVDVGIDVMVALAKGKPSSAGNTALATDLTACAEAFGLEGYGVVLHRTGQPPPWAVRSAELSALMRCLCTILECPVPAAARSQLDQIVAAEWGAHDAAPRVVDATTGERYACFSAWPSMAVQPVRKRPPMLSTLAAAMSSHPPAFDAAVLREPTAIDLQEILALVRRQADAVRTWCATQASGTSAITAALRQSPAIVVVPDAARIGLGPDTVPRWEGRTARPNVDAPDVLPG